MELNFFEIAGLVVAGLIFIGFLVVLVMIRDDGDGEMTISADVGSIDEPKL